jgi:hypothetical protein
MRGGELIGMTSRLIGNGASVKDNLLVVDALAREPAAT